MPDHASSADPAVQEQLDRLSMLSPGADTLGLDRITCLLGRLGDPQRHLPPVLHVAGTNGKGSTCAFLRAAIEAAGLTAHVYSSPHLVRFNERIRIAGKLIGDDRLAALLAEVLDRAEGIGASFFEVTTAVAFLAFAHAPAAATIVEVGLGGRLDATNVIPAPAVTGIAALGIDHVAFLGDTIEAIAAEKAGIAKPGVPLVTMCYPLSVTAAIERVAAGRRAPVVARGTGWQIEPEADVLRYTDSAGGLTTPAPRLAGPYQPANLGLALAMLRHQSAIDLPDSALRTAADSAIWPARMQRLADGPLTHRFHRGQRRPEIWLDGAHNESAAEAITGWGNGADVALVIGMLANKDAAGVLRHLLATAGRCRVVAIPVPGHDHHPPEALAALARELGAASAGTALSVRQALDRLASDRVCETVLIAGSLYLAGEVLRLNDEAPT